MAVITVRFYGRLKSFGETFRLEVADTAEALRALLAQLPKLRQTMQQGFYKVRIGNDYLNPNALEQGLFYRLKEGMTLHFTPVVKGAKKAGIFNVVLGAVLIGASFFTGGATLTIMGGAMMLGGVASMLTKTPKMGNGNNTEKKSSTAFGNTQNIAAQGQPIPLAYGRIRCGSMIISQGVETFNA